MVAPECGIGCAFLGFRDASIACHNLDTGTRMASPLYDYACEFVACRMPFSEND